jgi:hypothetical protein
MLNMVRNIMKSEVGVLLCKGRVALNKILFFLPLITNMVLFGDARMQLESSVVKIADGTFINADKIEYTRKYRRKLLDFILGDLLPNNQRKGKYNVQGKWCSVEDLARLEQESKGTVNEKNAKLATLLQELLTHAKADFIVQSTEFIESGRGAKNIMIVLIQEYCQKNNRMDSFLLEWAKTKEGQESTMFERHVNSFDDYYHFLSDLANFLMVLIHSCPKAEAQFKDRVAKWSAVKEILPTVLKKAHAKGDRINEIEFLKYLKERYLDSLTLSEITPHIIVPLLTEYIKHMNVHG